MSSEIAKLRQLYYDPETGFTSPERLLAVAREKGLNVNLKQVRAFVQNQQVAQLHAPHNEEHEYLHIVSPEKDAMWQADLIDLPKLAKENNGFRYILTVIDIYSRFAFAVPLRNKDGKSVAEGLDSIFSNSGRKPSMTFSTDAGSEFLNVYMRKLLADHSIEQYTAQAGDHRRLGMIERFNRTLKTFLAKYFTATGNNSWVNVLPVFLRNYNSQVHSTIGMKPTSVKQGDIQGSRDQDEDALDKFAAYNVGDYVRILKNTTIFTKGYESSWSKTVYIIAGISGYSFQVSDLKGVMQKKTYKWYEMQKINYGEVQHTPQGVKEIAGLRGADIMMNTSKLFKQQVHPVLVTSQKMTKFINPFTNRPIKEGTRTFTRTKTKVKNNRFNPMDVQNPDALERLRNHKTMRKKRASPRVAEPHPPNPPRPALRISEQELQDAIAERAEWHKYNHRSMNDTLAQHKYLKRQGYNVFELPYLSKRYLDSEIRVIHNSSENAYKINFGAAYMLRNVEDGTYKTFSPNENSLILETAKTIHNDESLQDALDKLGTFIDNLSDTAQRPNTKWSFVRLKAIYVYKTNLDVRIGSKVELPEFIEKARSIASFKDVPYNLCAFACIAAARDDSKKKKFDRYTAKAKELWMDFYKRKKVDVQYPGIELTALETLENHFKIRINVYRLFEDRTCELVRRTNRSDGKEVAMNLFTDEAERHHFSLIIKKSVFANIYNCAECDANFESSDSLLKHSKTCDTQGKVAFPGGTYQIAPTLFEKLIDVHNIDVPYTEYPLFFGYDTETYCCPLAREEKPVKGDKLDVHSALELMSVSFTSCFRGVISAPTFISCADDEGWTLPPKEIIRRFVSLLTHAREDFMDQIRTDFKPVFCQIRNLSIDEKDKVRLLQKLHEWIESVPIYGFNSSGFDMNVLKAHLSGALQEFGKRPTGLGSKLEKLYKKEVLKVYKSHRVRCGDSKIKIVVPGRKKPLEPDFAIEDIKTILEVNGCYWHGCPRCFEQEKVNPTYGNVTFGELYVRTQYRKHQLEAAGWTVQEVWECDFIREKKAKGELIDTISGIIKQGNGYRSLNNGFFHFKDIKAFLGPDANVAGFIKMYDCKLRKLHFPHGLTSSLHTFLYESADRFSEVYGMQGVAGILRTVTVAEVGQKWYSDLMGNITIPDKEYYSLVSTRVAEGRRGSGNRTLYELLEEYNNADVEPMCEAIFKHHQYFAKLGVDFHKQAISLPGVANLLLFKGLPGKEQPLLDFDLWRDEDRDIYFDLYSGCMRGGPAIVFCHYAKVGETHIRDTENLCGSCIGLDACSLYPWAMAQEMPLGRYSVDREPRLDQVRQGILDGAIFGFVKCSVGCPEGLLEYFAEFPPIFHNTEVLDKTGKPSRKLVSTRSATNVWLTTMELKWMLQHGLLLTDASVVVSYERAESCFGDFVAHFANERRRGDEKKEYALMAFIAKLIKNSSYGKTITNFMKHVDLQQVPEKQVSRKAMKNTYKRMTCLDGMAEMEFAKKRYKQTLPFQIGFMVYGYAKVRMLEFYYDFLDRYIPREYFQLQWMDTDSMYMALAGGSLDELVRPELRDEYEAIKKDWLVTTKYDERTPGLFKTEWSGTAMVALAPKMYYAVGHCDSKDKMSCKGTNKKQNKSFLTYENFMDIYEHRDEDVSDRNSTVNAGFRVFDSILYRYTQKKKGLSFRQDKRILLPDGRQTAPLY